MKIKITGFTKGIITLIISQIFIKLFGLVYSIYLTNKSGFGDAGNAIYMSGYQIYALLLTISSIGVPNTVSKMISEKSSIKDYINEDRIFKVSLFIFSCIGFISSIFLFALSGFISEKIIQIPETKLSLMVLSPAIFFVSVTSVLRGYCNGEKYLSITAKSQFIEQTIKTIFTIFFVELISKCSNSAELMAAGANAGTTVATIISLIHIILRYKKIIRKISSSKRIIFPKENFFIIVKNISKVSLPIIFSVLLSSLYKNIDSVTIVRILKKYFLEKEAIEKYGIISSKVDILIAFPLSFNMAIATALIPEIARNKVINNLDGIINKIKFSFWISIFIGIPCTFGMMFYSNEIFYLLFPNARSGAELLSLASISIIFLLLSQTITGILQGFGKNNVPLYATIIGLFIKISCNVILINIPGIYEKGAILGNIASNIAIFLIEFIYLKKIINLNFSVVGIGIIPTLSSIIMITISKIIYNYLSIKFYNKTILILFSIIFCIIIYMLFNFFSSIFNYFLKNYKKPKRA